MSTITSIDERRGLVEIGADGYTAVRIRAAHFRKYPLSVGDEIDIDRYVDQIAGIQFPDAYEAALNSLDLCARSAKEIESALRRKGYVEPAVHAVIARLTENRLIDDARYAERVVEVQSRKAAGLFAMKKKLKAKGISDADAEAALNTVTDEQQQDAALETARQLLRRYESLPGREARAKLSQALARRGFGWDAIEAALDALFD